MEEAIKGSQEQTYKASVVRVGRCDARTSIGHANQSSESGAKNECKRHFGGKLK